VRLGEVFVTGLPQGEDRGTLDGMARAQRPREAADALRTAVDRTVQATVGQANASRDKAQDLVDEVTQAAGKLRETLDDLRVATREDVRELADRLSSIERRLTALEKKPPAAKPKPKPKPKAAAARKTKPTKAK